MSLDLSFFILYLLSSLLLFVLQIWIYFLIYPVGGLTSHLVCRAANMAAMAIQLCLVATGRFPFNVLSSQVRFVDDMVRVLALVFLLLHGVVYIFLLHGGLPKRKPPLWRD
ncbi:hypothetical protein CHU32_06270 [Superficieibacter electus]|uniref:Uncharacterized protein n=1 Tax=Superficieibacter electus TaxID=2022662 RepID=A0A2P5GTE5_9ENTR|nr:hypothetical protein [Superficieibacter electus]POP46355.1 hypothetical protein CHU33_06255 [Superficieibacter electus]POP49826.1 hypothetical protein CHU32_06270 [Superficieibacter electus]